MMGTAGSYSVAVPWSLSHYIPLNGFHPLYRALFDQRQDDIAIRAWDNIEISHRLRSDPHLLAVVLKQVQEVKRFNWPFGSKLGKSYLEYFWGPNIALTNLLPGHIEFHHTAPFPTLRRPFVFHCESFAPVFFPFAQQGAGKMKSHQALRKHYRSILSNPLCLGIFSHIPETLHSLSAFFSSPDIDRKLHLSKIGLSTRCLPREIPIKQRPLTQVCFLFVNSVNQTAANFFHRGGHIVLRFWREYRLAGKLGCLYLRCTRPVDAELQQYDVDVAFLRAEEGSSVIWIEDYLANHELNALMANAHFFLLPSVSLHSVSIMQALALGTIPVVSDTVGTSLYVSDNENGIVLKGVLAASWETDSETGILVDHFRRNPDLDKQLVAQLTQRILSIVATPTQYERMRQNALERSRDQFSGARFSTDFWSKVSALYTSPCDRGIMEQGASHRSLESMAGCLLTDSDWPRVFEGATQPLRRLYTGRGQVSELGGAFVQAFGNPTMGVHDWSVLAEHIKPGAPPLKFVKSIRALDGCYLDAGDGMPNYRGHALVTFVSRIFKPYPILYRFGSRTLGRIRQYRHHVQKLLGIDKTRQQDIELVVEGLSGLNIIRCHGKYYAIPQMEGAFLLEKVEAAEYSVCFRGNTIRAVRRKIALAGKSELAKSRQVSQDSPHVELVSEGIFGFNIIRCADVFYAIPQGEGTFAQARVLAGDYSRIFSGCSIEEVRKHLEQDRVTS